jgi:tetratricopeptide (TPR) repeat protein
LSRDVVNLGQVVAAAQQRSEERADWPKITAWIKAKLARWLAQDAAFLIRMTTTDDYRHLMGDLPPEWFVRKLSDSNPPYFAPPAAAALIRAEESAAEVLRTHWHEYEPQLDHVTIAQLLQRATQDASDALVFRHPVRDVSGSSAVRDVGHFGDYLLCEFVSTHASESCCWQLRSALAQESARMHHCVGRFKHALRDGYGEHYARGIETRAQRIFSLRKGDKPVVTISCVVRDGRLLVSQVKAVSNALPKDSLRKTLHKVFQHIDASIEGCSDADDLGFVLYQGATRFIEDVTDVAFVTEVMRKSAELIRFFEQPSDALHAAALHYSLRSLPHIKERGPLVSLALILRDYQPEPTEVLATELILGDDVTGTFDLFAWLRASRPGFRLHHAIIAAEKQAIPWERVAWRLKVKAPYRRFDALACFLKAASLEPSRSDLWCESGGLAHDLGMDALAVQCLEKALRLVPDNHWAAHTLGDVHLQKGRVAEAAACYQIASATNCAGALFGLARALELKDATSEDCGPWYEKTASCEFDSHLFFKHFGLYLERRGEGDLATAWYKKTFLKYGDDLWTRAKLIEMRWGERPTEHGVDLAKMVAERRSFAWAWGRLALCQAHAGALEAARSTMKLAIAACAENPWLLAIAGDLDLDGEAVAWYGRALELDASYAYAQRRRYGSSEDVALRNDDRESHGGARLLPPLDLLLWSNDQDAVDYYIKNHQEPSLDLAAPWAKLRRELVPNRPDDLRAVYSALLPLARGGWDADSERVWAFVLLARYFGTTDSAVFYQAAGVTPLQVPPDRLPEAIYGFLPLMWSEVECWHAANGELAARLANI